jgi:ABC-type glycerol-3-phosphate transport system substrate-binding protein
MKKMRYFSKYVSFPILVILLLGSLFIGCTPKEPDATTQDVVKATQEPATEAEMPSEVQVFGTGNTAWAPAWQDTLVPAFNEVYPNIKVTVDGVAYDEMLAKGLLDASSVPSPYDFIAMDDPWTPALADVELLQDLKNDLTVPEGYDWEDFHSAPLAAGQWDGIQYAVPVRSNLFMLFYNRTLFEEAGLNADEELDGITWDEFEELLPKLVRDTNDDGEPDVWALATTNTFGALTPIPWWAHINSEGVQVLDDTFHPAFNNEIGVAALEQYVRFLDYGPPGILEVDFNQTNELFRQEKVAMMFQWGSVYRSVAVDPETTTLTPDQVGITALPGGSVCPASSHRGVWVQTIPKNGEHSEEAWAFLSWVTSKEGEQFMAENIGTFPARKSTLTSDPPAEWLSPVFNAILKGYDAIECGEMWRPRLIEVDQVQDILALQYSRTLIGEVTADEALDTAAKEIEQLLDGLGYYK